MSVQRRIFAVIAGGVILCLPGASAAQQEEDLAKPPPMPEVSEGYQPLEPGSPAELEKEAQGDVPIPPKVRQEQIEPTVRIIEEEDRRIEEYRRDGQVYMVRIVPNKGVPYYYIDTNGDGRLELDEDQRARNPVQPVYWKVKEWD